jgi:hypothetical protein
LIDPANGTAIRLATLERQVERLERLEPAVVKQQVTDIKDDIQKLSRDMERFHKEQSEETQGVRRILIGFLVTFAVLAVGTVVTVMQITQGAG